ncbi:MAG: hypothetical protein WBP12_02210 [Candidatus Saccharimonas sp.]
MGMQLHDDIHSGISPHAVEGFELLSSLSGVEGLRPRVRGVFDAGTTASMNAAIRVLLGGGYVPNEVNMVEGDFYSVEFGPSWDVYPYMDRWPYWVRLRFVTDGMYNVPLALACRTKDLYLWYLGSYSTTTGTHGGNAEKMRYHFEHDHPGVTPVWVPVFDRTPLLLKRDS